MQIISEDYIALGTLDAGYIAGSGDGIVTIGGQPAACKILVFDAAKVIIEQHIISLKNGHYLLNNLDPSKQYMVMARDYNREYEPAVWDYVTPATDLTIQQQQELWQSWQTPT
ncbi:hypothetical protein I6J32_09465 [Moraxella osloensis]|nr:hypothetical protein [Moraxella osloensis]QRO12836.1 hypothetical protein I6J32_09465 [Moraxella osloensis]